MKKENLVSGKLYCYNDKFYFFISFVQVGLFNGGVEGVQIRDSSTNVLYAIPLDQFLVGLVPGKEDAPQIKIDYSGDDL